jgi:hypothetical protein
MMMRLQSGRRQLQLCEDACSIGSTTGASATKWPESDSGETGYGPLYSLTKWCQRA